MSFRFLFVLCKLTQGQQYGEQRQRETCAPPLHQEQCTSAVGTLHQDLSASGSTRCKILNVTYENRLETTGSEELNRLKEKFFCLNHEQIIYFLKLLMLNITTFPFI